LLLKHYEIKIKAEWLSKKIDSASIADILPDMPY